MKRENALAIFNGYRLIAMAASHLLLPHAARRIGAEPYHHEAGLVREALFTILHKHAGFFEEAQRVLTKFDDDWA